MTARHIDKNPICPKHIIALHNKYTYEIYMYDRQQMRKLMLYMLAVEVMVVV